MGRGGVGRGGDGRGGREGRGGEGRGGEGRGWEGREGGREGGEGGRGGMNVIPEPYIPSGTSLQLLRYRFSCGRLQLKNRMIPPMTRYADALRDPHAICRGNPWP